MTKPDCSDKGGTPEKVRRSAEEDVVVMDTDTDQTTGNQEVNALA